MKFHPLIVIFAIPFLTFSCADERIRTLNLNNIVDFSTDICEGKRCVLGNMHMHKKASRGYIELASGDRIECRVPDHHSSSVSDYTGRALQFELLTRLYSEPSYVFNDVLKISDGDKVLVDFSLCSIHKCSMKRIIEVVHDMPFSDDFFTIRARKFPNDGNSYLPCGSGIRHPTWGCHKCKTLSDEWWSMNPDPRSQIIRTNHGCQPPII